MYVSSVILKDYRNYENIDVELSSGINILYGANAQGKTNFIEALYFAATGRSHRTNFDKELIRFDRYIAGIRVYVEKGNIIDRIDVNVKKEGVKAIAVNGIAVKKLSELFGSLYSVIFSPEDLLLVNDGPSARRRFIDMEICQLNPVYYHELGQYYKILRQRNSLLKDIIRKRDVALKDTLCIWDEQLVAHGVRIIEYRRSFVKKIGKLAGDIHKKITDNIEELSVTYKNNVEPAEFMARLGKNRERDIALGTTSVGIHKDDLVFMLNDIDARIYGSQGQRRCVSLSLKLAEIELIKEEAGKNPILLLDDVLSELDSKRQKSLIESIGGIQTIVTCTGIDVLKPDYFGNNAIVKIYNVENGRIIPQK